MVWSAKEEATHLLQEVIASKNTITQTTMKAFTFLRHWMGGEGEDLVFEELSGKF